MSPYSSFLAETRIGVDDLPPPNLLNSSAPVALAKRQSSLLVWLSMLVISILAATSVVVSVSLHRHADRRRAVMDEVAQVETLATAQSSLVWRALTLLMAEERLSFAQIRGEEQRRRSEIQERLVELIALEDQGAEITRWLGFEPEPEVFERLQAASASFLSSVQGTLGQMNLSPDRIRKRLKFWDMQFGPMEDALQAVKDRSAGIAAASSVIANAAAMVASLITLFAAGLFVLRLSQLRNARQRELHEQHMRSVKTSEARFRELVQNGSDLILVLETSGEVRYATPSADMLRHAVHPDDASKASFEAFVASRRGGAGIGFEAQSVNVRWRIQDVLGHSPHEFLRMEQTEVEVICEKGRRRVFDVKATDLIHHPAVEGIVLNARDITDRKALEERLRYQALHDPLTNLPNRRQFKQRFDELDSATRKASSVLYLDLDGFKLVNDSYGHKMGDALLVATASRILGCIHEDAVLARQGGDEFLLLVTGDGERVGQAILDVLGPPFQFEGKEIFASASVGIVTDLSGLNSDEVAQRADIAMYEAKKAGKGQAMVFVEEMMLNAPERIQLESDFRRALERREFEVFYQPKVGLRSGQTESLEALVRWAHPERGFVSPDAFITFAEDSGLICELGRQVLEQACNDAVRWQPYGVVVAVNLLPIQFRNPNLVQEVLDVLERTGLPPQFLELEITESAVLGDVTKTVEVLAELKKVGVRLAIDDFGTGYSNLSHLKHYNVDVLKIDQAFVRGGQTTANDSLSDGAIVEAVIGMAKAFDLHVVAEGVETQSHADDLRALGADTGQGYFFSKPVPAGSIDELLEQEAQRRFGRAA